MTKRSPLAVVALTLVTLTIYAYYWLYTTTDELRRESDRDDLSPIVDVVLTLLTLGIWGIWAGYRNARIVHELCEERGIRHSDRSLAVGAFGALSFVSGWAWLVAMVLLQEDYNMLVERFDYFDDAPHAQVRVENNEPAERPFESAPSTPVFESSAPRPNVY